jgi:sugar lactone lactonase YvrE
VVIRLKKIIKSILFGLLLLFLALLIITRLTLGSGRDYPDLSTEPLIPSSKLEIVATMDMPLGNPAVSADGRIFFNLHPLAEPEGATVFEWVEGEAIPYPDAEFQEKFHNVLGMFIDGQNRLWTLDNASLESTGTRLLAFDLDSGEVVHDHFFGDDFAFLNDLQLSPDGRTIYFSDPGLLFLKPPAIVVYDIESGETRRLLEGHESVKAQNLKIQTAAGDMWLLRGLIRFRLGIDGIALSKDGNQLYYGGINHDTLYRIPTKDLLDPNLSDEALAGRVEAVGQKPLSDGFSIDLEDNVTITDVEHSGLVRMAPDGTLLTLVRDERVRWADGISFGPDGAVYFTDSALNVIFGLLPAASQSKVEANAPYHLFRFQSDVEGVPGG